MELKENPNKYSLGRHIFYSVGGFLDNFITTAFAARVFAYYETEIILPSFFVMIAFVLYGLWNMINDPLAGYISDRPTRFTKKWGRRFPWFIMTVIPCAIVYLFIFIPPLTNDLIIFFWFLIFICLFDGLFSFWNTNWVGIFPDMFRSQKERTKVAAITTAFSQIGLALGMIIPPLFIQYNNLGTYVISALVVTIISLACILFMIPGVRENDELIERTLVLSKKEQISYIDTLKFAIRQKNFTAYLVAYLAQIVIFVIMLGSVSYLVRFLLHANPAFEIVLSAALLLGGVVSIPFWTYLSRKKGNKYVYMFGMGLMSIVLVPLFFVIEFYSTLACLAIMGFSMGGTWFCMYPMFSDIIDEIVVKTGKRQEGTYIGIRTFVGRLSIVIQAVSFWLIHFLTGFNPGFEYQTIEALWGIRIQLVLIPLICYFMGFIFMWRVCDLTKEKVARIKNELKKLNL